MFKVKDCNFGRVVLSSANGEREFFYVKGGRNKIRVGGKKGVLTPFEEKEMTKFAQLIFGIKGEEMKHATNPVSN